MKVKYGDTDTGSSVSSNMVDLIAFHTYPHSFLSPPRMIRRSSNNRSASPEKTVTKARSTNDLSGVSPGRPPTLRSSSSNFDGLPSESDFNTLKDPRLTSTTDSDVSRASSTSSQQQPDLTSEVTALSAKLIQAINNQTTLDDTLVATRQVLDRAQARALSLELDNEKFRRDIATEVLVRKVDMDQEIMRLEEALAQEKAQRFFAEQGKKTIEQELEELTTALFEEANKMVAAAKIERDAVEKKNEQLRSQVKDTELLLASHQDQLSELKSVMQGMGSVKDESDNRMVVSPSLASPTGLRQPPIITKSASETENAQDVMPDVDEMLPGPSTSFPHFIKTVCRTDLPAYNDFHDLLVQAKRSNPPSRATSGSYSGLGVMGLASGFGSAYSSPAKSQMSHSPNGSLSSPQHASSQFPLKETRFYKRAVMEDIEPTLRLDASPGISWLARRTVMSSICDGSLVIEPMPSVSKKWAFPCSLCGERRDAIDNERTHRFRTSDNESAQRYPLCVPCVEKMRSCCEFTGYLRLIVDGHVRTEDVGDEEDAWEETIRLRERMFWSRVGAGVIPTISRTNNSKPELPTVDNDARRVDPSKANCHNGIQQQSRESVDDNDKLAATPNSFLPVEPRTSTDKGLPANETTQNLGSAPTYNTASDDSPKNSTDSVFFDVSEKGELAVDATIFTEEEMKSELNGIPAIAENHEAQAAPASG